MRKLVITRLGRRVSLLMVVLIIGAVITLEPVGASIPDSPPPVTSAVDELPPSDPGTVIARFRPGVSESTTRAAAAKQGLRVLRPVGPNGDVLVATQGKSPAEAVARLRADRRVETADPNYERRAAVVPDDPRFVNAEQPYLNNLGMLSAWVLSRD
jgi:hypothetical protein